jgi:hypothetical protein
MPVYERINVTVSLTLIGLALYFVLDFPAETATFLLFNSPLALVSPQQWLMSLLLAAMAVSGTHAVLRFNPALTGERLPQLAPFVLLPGLLVVLATQTLGLAPHTVAWAAGLITAGAILWITILAQYLLAGNRVSPVSWPRWWHQGVGYGVAFALFMVIYYTRTRSAMSATGVLLVSGMVSLALLGHSRVLAARVWLFAGVIGLAMAQITWALNYWRISVLQAGLLLLLVFYALVGLAQQHLLGGITRRALWEFGATAILILALIFYL